MTHPDDERFLAAIDAAAAESPPNHGRIYDVLLGWCDYLQDTGRELEAEGIREAVVTGRMPDENLWQSSGRWDWWQAGKIDRPESSHLSSSLFYALEVNGVYRGRYDSCSAAWSDLGAAYAKMVGERQPKRDQNAWEALTIQRPIDPQPSRSRA